MSDFEFQRIFSLITVGIAQKIKDHLRRTINISFSAFPVVNYFDNSLKLNTANFQMFI